MKKAANEKNGMSKPKKMGRTPLLSENDVAELTAQQRARDLAKNSATGPQLQTIIYNKRKEAAASANKNVFGVGKVISRRSLQKYKQLIVPVTVMSATVQNPRRLQAISDKLNFISLLGVFMCLLSIDLNDKDYRRVRPELTFNLDAMSVKAGPPSAKQQTANLTVGVKEEMSKQHARSVGITGAKTMKYRCVKHHFLTSGDGVLHGIFMLIKDNSIKELDVRRAIVTINGAEVHLILTPANKAQQKRILEDINQTLFSSSSKLADDDDDDAMDLVADDGDDAKSNDNGNNDNEEEKDDESEAGLTNFDVLVMKKILCEIVLDKVLDVRASFVRMEKSLLATSASSSSSSKAAAVVIPGSSKSTTTEEDPDKPAVTVLVDGDHSQIEGVMRSMNETPEFKQSNVDMIKLPAGCSLALQPNDLMVGRRDLRTMVTVSDYTTKITKERLPLMSILARTVDKILQEHGVEKASRDIFVNYSEDLSRLVSASFTVAKVKVGWEVSGLCPFEPMQLLQQCPSFKGLSYDEGQIIAAKFPLLRERAFYTGHLTDEDMYDIYGDLISSEITNMSSRPLIQQRAILLNSPAAIDIRRKKLLEKQTKEAAAASKRVSADKQKKLEVAVKTAIQNNQLQLFAGPPPDEFPTSCYGSCKAPLRHDHVVGASDDDGWRACPCCKKIWCCMKYKKCRNDMANHVSVCLVASYLRGKVELAANILSAAAAAA